ncbi:MAG: GUN4 domain-containing protein [Limnospira sp. PMC 894.15]|uniref:GUN4 domain-containing protein n=1 Tax=Limnospira TaxID=2596745 RepID=UPI0028E16309|nr:MULTISPECIES: GUN4 domain-containing protein [unclassified Limnospira]MDT9187974.1 GUN4 domain-containing protein [Limnospira sp. PMC 894.15]MDT9275819.1 GUN4 domain-containing protein [Limnospira sp. PMC 737.11]MDY7051505.1 GUN4 domain-containing protein [Limnospira fusiformis LS22]
MIGFWLIVLTITLGLFFVICKWEYDSHESLTELESDLRSGKWGLANIVTGRLIAIIIYRDCKRIPCISHQLSKRKSWVGKFLYKVTNQRQEKAGIEIHLGSTSSSYVSTEDMEKFPIEKLQAIDNLWTKYSQGRFGFSVQASIYEKYGKTSSRSIKDDEFMLNEFGEKLWSLPAGSKIKPGQVRLWYRIDFADYAGKHEKDLFLKLNWLYEPYKGYEQLMWQPPGHDFTDVEGVFPHFHCPEVSFLLWRKLLRGSVID